jgi:hypothetical protein
MAYTQEWFTYFVEADSQEEAEEIVIDGNCDEFESTGSDFDVLEIEEITE